MIERLIEKKSIEEDFPKKEDPTRLNNEQALLLIRLLKKEDSVHGERREIEAAPRRAEPRASTTTFATGMVAEVGLYSVRTYPATLLSGLSSLEWIPLSGSVESLSFGSFVAPSSDTGTR